jgi:hypothetical protein
VSSTRIVETIDVFEDRYLSQPPGYPLPPPDQFGIDVFEERLDGRIVMTIIFAAHRDFEAMLAQDFLLFIRNLPLCPAHSSAQLALHPCEIHPFFLCP